jgi:hypothetical protein
MRESRPRLAEQAVERIAVEVHAAKRHAMEPCDVWFAFVWSVGPKGSKRTAWRA